MTTVNYLPATSPPATRSRNDNLRALPSSLRSEWIKISTIRSNGAILALTIALNGIVSWAVAEFVTDQGELFVEGVFSFSTVFTAVFAAIAGILIFSSEAQHGTLAPTLTAQPVRLVTAAAKMIIAVAFGTVLGAAGLAVGIAGAKVAGLRMGDTAAIVETSLWALLYVSLATLLGLGVGMIARNGTAAISGLLVWWLVVESLFTVVVDPRISRFMPFAAGNGLVAFDDDVSAEALAAALTRTEGALVFGGYVAVALAIGAVLLQRRDTN